MPHGTRLRVGPPANDNDPPLRHFMSRLVWSIAIAAAISGLATVAIHLAR